MKQEPCINEQDLLLFHYRELPEQHYPLLEDHLVDCQRCRQKLYDLIETLGLVAAPPMEWSRSDQQRFSARLMDRLPRRRLPVGLWAGGLASAAVLLALLLPLSGQVTPQPPARTPVLTVMAELDMLEQLDFLQTLDLLEMLDLLETTEPLG